YSRHGILRAVLERVRAPLATRYRVRWHFGSRPPHLARHEAPEPHSSNFVRSPLPPAKLQPGLLVAPPKRATHGRTTRQPDARLPPARRQVLRPLPLLVREPLRSPSSLPVATPHVQFAHDDARFGGNC